MTRNRPVKKSPLLVPILMAVVILLIGVQVACVYKIPSPGNDEPAHLGYIGTLAEGKLPTIDSPIVDDPARYGDLADSLQGWDKAHQGIWVANHPPLFHLALVPLFKLGGDDPRSVFIAMRLVNTLGFALWVLLVGLVARELVPRRSVVPALAAVVAVTPTLALRSGFLMNDGMSCAAGLLMVLMVIRLMRHEVTPARVAVAALAGTAAAGSRASGALTVAVCAIVLLVGLVRRQGWRRGILVSAVVGGVPAAATGWFYLRNLRLYGDFTGQQALLAKFDRTPASIWHFWSIPGIDEAVLSTPLLLLALAALSPLAAARWFRSRGPRIDSGWVLLVLLTLATLQNVVSFVVAGGGFHDRYLMPVMPFLATVAALGMLHLGELRPRAIDPERRDWFVSATWTAVLLVWLAVALAWLEHHYIYRLQDHTPVGTPYPQLLLGAAAVVGLIVVASMVGRARSLPAPPSTEAQTEAPTEAPTEAQRAEPALYSDHGMFQSP